MKKSGKFIFIAGPCVIENIQSTMDIAMCLHDLSLKYPVSFIFKASFDKANRTSLTSFRGPGLIKGIKILEKIKKKLDIPILSDVHEVSQINAVKDVLDVIQIPAFLCRQTDLVLAAATTRKIVNIKKGQFLAPYDMNYIVKKVESTGNKNIFLTERGTCFGYNNLIVDFRSFPIMKSFGYPIIFDVTHSLQQPSAHSGVSGGDISFVPALSRAAVAAGVDGLFIEVHPDPRSALSDKYTSYPLQKVRKMLEEVIRIKELLNKEG